jgi:hypothetical protein
MTQYRVVEKTWLNGKLVDEQLIHTADSFAQATEFARGRSGGRVRLNNNDVTVSIEKVDQPATEAPRDAAK